TIAAAGHEVALIGAQADYRDIVHRPAGRTQLLVLEGIPDTHRLVGGGIKELLAIRAITDDAAAILGGGVLVREQTAATRGVPNANRLVGGSAGQLPAVGAESEVEDGAIVAMQAQQLAMTEPIQVMPFPLP